MEQLTLTRPDDWHLHVRDGAVLDDVVPATAQRFARAIIMPNLKPPVTTVTQALAYRERILAAVPGGLSFEPLMTLYLTDNTSPDEIEQAFQNPHIHGIKYYPAGATTHSDASVTDIAKTYPALEKMAELGLPLLVHGEVTDPTVDIFHREQAFINAVLQPLRQRIPTLRIVFEHITTQEAIDFVMQGDENLAATITAHHLLYNRNAMFKGGLRPHYYCLPVLKHERHRKALIAAATSGNTKFFLGTDSAPHAKGAKETACGCAGIYSAHAALELYAEAFEAAGALDKLEGFASFHGADFYGLPRNTATVTLVKKTWTVPEQLPFGGEELVPLHAGREIPWKISQ